jgi:hypothetical protein
MKEVLEVQEWPSNSELIEAVFEMHVWPKKWASCMDVLDMTYGRGVWWKWTTGFEESMMTLFENDLRQGGFDYREMPYGDNCFDVIAFDPDYIAPGGRESSTIQEFNDRYGLKDQYESPAALQLSINAGVAELARMLQPQGIGLVKCTNYISSGKVWLGEYETIRAGLNAGLLVEDIFVHVSKPGPQPDRPDSKQQHARSNSSRLIVFRKPGRRGSNA